MAHGLDTQYYPFLKGKAGELEALRSLRVESRQGMTPLFDVPPERVRFFGVGAKKQIQIETITEALEAAVDRGDVDPRGASEQRHLVDNPGRTVAVAAEEDAMKLGSDLGVAHGDRCLLRDDRRRPYRWHHLNGMSRQSC